jgi:type IV secretion system protein VirD4
VLSVIATAEAQTRMFRDEAICAALDGEGFDFGRMKRCPMAVYLVLPGDYLKERARYLRLILNAALAQFMRSAKGRRRVLVVLDEFANLGRLAMVKQGFGLIRGYGVTLWAFVQDLTQLQQLYPDDWGTFEANTGAVTVASVNDNTTAEYFIRRAGKAWTRQTTTSRNAQKKAFALHHDGESTGETIREELRNTLDTAELFDGGKSVFVFFAGRMEPVKAGKAFYDRYIYRARADKNPMHTGG